MLLLRRGFEATAEATHAATLAPRYPVKDTRHTLQPMLRFENLSKRYGERLIFQGLHDDITSGCVALNDESGSGKSTLLGLLAGTIEPDAGEVWLGGHSLRTAPLAAKSVLTYVPEDCMTYPDQTGREYLNKVASARKTAVTGDTLDLADRFGLTPHLDKRFEQMSFGTRKKIFLTAAVLGETRVLIADEPVGGLDAAARAVLVDLFRTLAQTRTVFFSSYDTVFTDACEARSVTFADLGGRG
ncbi:ABC-type multidrug transport system, ATPase component [Burkholderia sp. Ch1-1]|uniref:ABC-type multidrug transport system, ATPase component n=2 Tax=Burkholderiaceae TaxID=119060 RepID=A0A5Q4YXC4_9BURK|nr:ABC-type multidrug transport system, ATPase component [Burkholderia sp. Ch1-1]VVD32102.1 ABC-type multidrug transport system, ATPase component [Paraburkholderia dioscoreae]